MYENFLADEIGYLETDEEFNQTLKIRQKDLKNIIPCVTLKKSFDLNFPKSS